MQLRINRVVLFSFRALNAAAQSKAVEEEEAVGGMAVFGGENSVGGVKGRVCIERKVDGDAISHKTTWEFESGLSQEDGDSYQFRAIWAFGYASESRCSRQCKHLEILYFI